jgi:prepilin-type N-terminal cleavage/methylation domain-containing protein
MTVSFRTPVNRRAGFTLLELMATACIISVLAVILLDRVQFYQKMAEKTAMEQTAGILRSALHLQFAELITKDKVADAQYLIGQNPMNWLTEKPGNYAGEFFGDEPGDVTSGEWYFDLQNRDLIYLVHNRKKDESHVRITFRTKLVLDTKELSGADRADGRKVVAGVVLEQIVPYVWK